MKIFVTVGMGRWQFDRLLEAVRPLCVKHEVIIQSGTSKVYLNAVMSPFISAALFRQYLQEADVIITHAGNTVRLVQRLGRVPLAMAREKKYGEMANDHQVRYLKEESAIGLVIPVWDPQALPQLVEQHPETEPRLLAQRSVPAPASSDRIITVMNGLCRKWLW